MPMRRSTIERNTSETQIRVALNLDGTGEGDITTPIPFLSHMLEQLPRHGLFDVSLALAGDAHIDGHHCTEDVGIALGQAVAQALGDKAGIGRYGAATLPMDEACVTCALDLSGRAFTVWQVPLPKAKVGDFDCELAEVFFEGFARGASCNLHMHLVCGANLHHIIEICFKAFARALRQAVERDARVLGVPSTKGSLA
ncbi:MAG: imidazoleglycerol-phosphate dehydratase HisB [Polyangiales bacterium]